MGYYIAAGIGAVIGFFWGALLSSSDKDRSRKMCRCDQCTEKRAAQDQAGGRYDFHTVEGFEELYHAVKIINDSGYEIAGAAPLNAPCAVIFRRPDGA